MSLKPTPQKQRKLCTKMAHYHLSIAHYFLIFFLASSYPHTSKLHFGDALPSSKPCIDEERRALLAFKQDLTDPSGRLSSWVGQACCQWKGISCKKITGHVEKIDLQNTYTYTLSVFDGEWDEMENSSLGGKINPSLLSLKHLSYLDLSRNDFQGIPIPTFFGQLKSLRRDSSHLGNLSNLNYLDLSEESYYSLLELASNNLKWLSNLSSLKYLSLEGVDLSNTGVSLVTAFNKFPSLLELHLPACHIKSLPFSLGNVNFTSLLFLDMSYNDLKFPLPEWFFYLTSLRKLDLSGQIPKIFGNFCNLKTLNLANNQFEGGIQELLGGLSSCPNSELESLDLSSNKLKSQLPASVGMLHNLKYLNLYNNDMSGSIPKSLGQLSELVHLDLSLNSWEGFLTEAHFTNLTRLKYFSLGKVIPNPTLPIPLIFNVSYEWVPPFKLHKINIGNCKVDSIPEDWFMKLSSQIEYLDLSSNQIRGKLPLQLKLPNALLLDLSHNQFDGPIPLWSGDNVVRFKLETNSFSGTIPLNFDQKFPKLESFYLAENHLHGIIPPSICNMKHLYVLSLRNNKLSGEFPQAWSLLPHVTIVDVAYNNLSGNLPSSMGDSGSLFMLKMNNNNFEGEIPFSLQTCTALRNIDLGNNRFTGEIPPWIGSTALSVSTLRLRSNFLSGHIPQQLCNLAYLHILDLAHNWFSGTIPKCLNNLTGLRIFNDSFYDIYLEYDQQTTVMRGRELQLNTSLAYVKSIDLSSNRFEGEIPQEICTLVLLRNLNLSMNQFSGNIPSKIGNLSQLDTLDLSLNHLSGQIPQSLSSLTFLSNLNFSYNNLSGEIPLGNQLQALPDSSIYEGNPFLCGFPLSTKCSEDGNSTPKDPKDNDNEDGNEKFWFYVSMALGFIVGFWGVFGTLIVKKSWRYAYFRWFDDIKDKATLCVRRLVCQE
ncbi:disease resistance family protein / LRR family protein [Prunus dulcis]|uniref:Disease resistance family protein / LRR family protein n=1 Tax=Prunus dulcis TaxID=3755 RepID=A0A4Y1RBM5_PRUDU|nr:disease resistance family protein / LRR family protein [Prunus dulcis]